MILRPEHETNGGGVLAELRGRSGARSIIVVFCFVFFSKQPCTPKRENNQSGNLGLRLASHSMGRQAVGILPK